MRDWTSKLLKYQLSRIREQDNFAKMLASEMIQDLCTGKDINGFSLEEKEEIYQLLDDIIVLTLGGGDHAIKLKNSIHFFVFGRPLKRRIVFEKTFDYKAESCLNQLDSVYSYVLSEICTTQQPTATQRLSWLLFFAAANGGLCFIEGQQALLASIIQNEKPIHKIGDFDCVSLVYQKSHHHTNMKVDDERKTRRLWLPDPLTLAAIKGFLKYRDELGETNGTTWEYLKSLLNRCPNAKQLQKFKQQKVYLALSLWFANQPGKAKPAFLRAFASGDLPSASTSLNCLSALTTQTCKAAYLRQVEFGIYRTRPKAKPKKHSVTAHGFPFIQALRKACAIYDEEGHKRTNAHARQGLKMLLTKYDDFTSAEEILIEWMLAQFEHEGSWNTPAAALRNLSIVGAAWLKECGDTDLYSADTEELFQIYEAIINLKKDTETKIYSTLRRVLLFAHETLNTELPDNLSGFANSCPHVRSALISEAHFQQLLTDIGRLFANESEETIEALTMMLILARRLGLRPIELIKLKLIELTPQGNAFIIIRPNEFGNNKTYCAYRILELMPFLLVHEQVAFWAYYKRRCDRVSDNLERLLFSVEAYHDVPFHTRTLSEPVGQLLAQYLGESAPLYQFRHSALSIWQVIQFGSDEIITRLTPYSLEQAAEIRKFLSRGEIQDRFYQISALAGHLSPDITITTYCHHTDIILYECAKRINRTYSAEVWQKLCGIRPSTLTNWLRGQHWYRIDMAEYSPNQLEPFVKDILREDIKHIAGGRQATVKFAHIENKRTELTMAACEQILCSYDNGKPFGEIADMCNLRENQISSVVCAAREIKGQYQTSKQQSRLYPANYEGLSFPKLNFKSESHDMRSLCKSLNDISDNNHEKLKKVTHLVLSNISQAHSEIILSCPSELKQILKFAKLFTSENRWELEVSLLEGKTTVSAKWKKACGEVRLTTSIKTVKNATLYPIGQARLYYLQPSDNKYCEAVKKEKGYKRFSSNVFKRVMHLQAILFLVESQLDEKARSEALQQINVKRDNTLAISHSVSQLELMFE